MNSVATEQLWIDFGLDSAVFLDYIAHWIHLNSSNKQPRNFHDGRYWTYNTLDSLHSIFPGWPKETIRNIIRKCVKNGLLIVSNYNKKKYDRTNWYSLSDLALQYYPKLSHLIHQHPDNLDGASCGDFTAPCGDFTAAIPKTLTTNNFINKVISKIDDSSSKLPEKNKSTSLKKSDLIKVNPFEIPESMIDDYLTVRKSKRAPITPTSWNKLHEELKKCQEQGFNAIKAFETMVTHGWQSLKIEWLQNQERQTTKKPDVDMHSTDWANDLNTSWG